MSVIATQTVKLENLKDPFSCCFALKFGYARIVKITQRTKDMLFENIYNTPLLTFMHDVIVLSHILGYKGARPPPLAVELAVEL